MEEKSVEVLVVAGFDEVSEQVIKTLRKIAEELLRKGIYVFITIQQVWWHDPVRIAYLTIPQVYVNNKLLLAGPRIINKEFIKRRIIAEANAST